jgi:hypothetical protein
MKQIRPENLPADAVAWWDEYDRKYAEWELIKKHFRPPDGYSIDPKEWDGELMNHLEGSGCDWLVWMMEFGGNVIGSAVKKTIFTMSKEIEELKARTK